jgi:hypothetical protein
LYIIKQTKNDPNAIINNINLYSATLNIENPIDYFPQENSYIRFFDNKFLTKQFLGYFGKPKNPSDIKIFQENQPIKNLDLFFLSDLSKSANFRIELDKDFVAKNQPNISSIFTTSYSEQILEKFSSENNRYPTSKAEFFSVLNNPSNPNIGLN